MKPLKVHKIVRGTDHIHKNPHLLPQLTDRPDEITASKRLLIHQDFEVAFEFSEKRLKERVFLDVLVVLFAAN